ncbi:hypothetical protein [Flavobacterium lipolyticum]|uniref:Uncharacterized protein n=1 Tax=Flavobacterium lipolyticum TaxID=2893754 RepID=A0ABS8LVZ9_9FLAO|nr:hypothetical protein [Flavobacterium sp. F-126]MCC9016704.1 hypothetical protein [Flavobacterium sp. F-126]
MDNIENLIDKGDNKLTLKDVRNELRISKEIVIESTENLTNESDNKLTSAEDVQSELGISKEVIAELNNDINNMISFAVHNGIIVDPEINSLVQNSNIDSLLKAYNILCKNISPVTPKSISFCKLMASKWNSKNIFTKMPITKNLFITSCCFLIAFICTSLSSEVNMNSLDEGVLNNEGISGLLNLLYLISLAGLGVMFYLLRSINYSIRKGTITPEDSAYFPIVIILGLISGLIMSEILSFQFFDHKDSGLLFNKSLLAILGGFASDVLFSILYSLINKIKKTFEVVPIKKES